MGTILGRSVEECIAKSKGDYPDIIEWTNRPRIYSVGDLVRLVNIYQKRNYIGAGGYIQGRNPVVTRYILNNYPIGSIHKILSVNNDYKAIRNGGHYTVAGGPSEPTLPINFHYVSLLEWEIELAFPA